MPKGTRKSGDERSGKGKGKVLKVDSSKGIQALESMLKEGKITIVLIYADWCGHCHKFMDNIWEPSCSKPAIHNRAAVREDVLKQTSLKDANFDGYPSVIVVDEKGEIQEFNNNGKTTNAIPQPKSEEDLTSIANAAVAPVAPVSPVFQPQPQVKEDVLQPNGERIKTFTPADIALQRGGGGGGLLLRRLEGMLRRGLAFPHRSRKAHAKKRKTRRNK